MIRKIARPMLASVYIVDGVSTVINPSAQRESAESVLSKLSAVLPAQYKAFLPSSPEMAAQIVGGVKAGAGSLFALGKAPRTAAVLLAVTAIPSVVGRHAFWEATDDEEKARRRSGAVTDAALLGGILLATVDTNGNPDLQWRTKNAAHKAKKGALQALPTQSESEKALGKVGNWISDTTDQVSSYVDDNKDDWAKTASSLAKDAKEQTSNLLSSAGDWIDDASDQAQDVTKDLKPSKVQQFKAKRKVNKFADNAQSFVSDAVDNVKDAAEDAKPGPIQKFKAKRKVNGVVGDLQSSLSDLGPSGLDKVKAKRGAKKVHKRAEGAVSDLQDAFDDLDLAPSRRKQRKAKKNVKNLQKQAEKAVKKAQKKLG